MCGNAWLLVSKGFFNFFFFSPPESLSWLLNAAIDLDSITAGDSNLVLFVLFRALLTKPDIYIPSFPSLFGMCEAVPANMIH